ncbi:MAG: 3-deoxy-D-manno-octulosonic acid transferase [Alphaproteobacteria bacterium]|nr:3-deoxy-D-manno-octulosonic acid transferase [Alphaproteobacteria bacterium]
MTASLALYTLGTRLAEPAARFVLGQRLKRGKERSDRIGERTGQTSAIRPPGQLLWMHGASVGESRLLVDLFATLRQRRPDVSAVITTQTLTSADMIAAWEPDGIVHQMAPVDGPGAVKRFLDHWRPDAAVFAEGEIWPNMLITLRQRSIPAALVNARMTERSLRGWQARKASARQLFAVFRFIGAADRSTAEGLESVLGRPIEIVGNLKRASPVEPPSAKSLDAWRLQIGARKTLLAASTHRGEEDMALEAFAEVLRDFPDALLVIVPRHPERGGEIIDLCSARGLSAQLRSSNPSAPAPHVRALVADTIGELVFWYAASDAVFLGGATSETVGGHNAIEPAQLGKRVFTGPHGYNFRETFLALEKAGALVLGRDAPALARYWIAELKGESVRPDLTAFFAQARAPLDASINAISQLLADQTTGAPG